MNQQTTQLSRTRWMIVGVVMLGVLMSTLDFSMINISLPVLAQSFGVPVGAPVQWIIIAYSLSIAAILVPVGRLADLLGQKTVWMAGLVIFTTSSTLCSISPWLSLLIAARAIQGIGAACMTSVSPILMTRAFAPQERGRALGIYAVIVGVGTSAGPTVGGLLMTWGSWHWMFLVNVPIGLTCLLLSVRLLSPAKKSRYGVHIDMLGAPVLALGVTGIVVGCSLGQEWGWMAWPVLILLGTGLLLLALLPLLERYTSHPILLLSLWHKRLFVSALLSSLLNFVALIAVSFLLSLYLQDIRRFSVLEAGLLLTAVPITIALLSSFSGALADRWGTRWLAAAGLTISSLGLVGMARLQTQSSLWEVIGPLILIGIGRAMFQAPNTSAALGVTPREHQASTSALLATTREMGSSLSIALAGALLAYTGGADADRMLALHLHNVSPAPFQQAFLKGFHLVFLVYAAIASIGALISLTRGEERSPHDRKNVNYSLTTKNMV